MPISTKSLCIFVVVLLCGCEEWPPHGQEIKDHFAANEADIILLRDKLLDSKYLSVAEFMGVEVHGEFYEGELADGTVMMTEQPPNGNEWLRIFKRSEIDSVGRGDYGSTSVSLSRFYFRGNLTENIDWSASYVHDPDLPSQVRSCGNKNPKVRCGSCISELGNGWWLQYWWSPYPYLPEAEKALLNGEISQDEYFEMSFRARDMCFAEGGMFLKNEGPR